jgi:integrase
MTVTIRPAKGGGWEVDLHVPLPDGTTCRDRKRIKVRSESAARRWADERARHLLQNGKPQRKRKEDDKEDSEQKEVPTLAEFAPRFVDQHARAEQLKPSGIAHKETVLRAHLVPRLGKKTLDSISTEDVQQLKHHLRNKAPKTVNNVLTVLNTLLKKAVEWKAIKKVPCSIRLLKVSQPSIEFFDFEPYERLVAAARQIDTLHLVIVLLGGDGGLRVGEIPALPWTHVDFDRRQLCVEFNNWRGQIGTTKGNRLRYVPMTRRLEEALRAHRHLRGPLVVVRPDNRPMTYSALVEALHRVERAAGLPLHSPHKLKHTFCSHLGMRGAAPLTLKELAAHKNLATTMRYIHTTDEAKRRAIRLLESHGADPETGDILETGISRSRN